MANEISNNPTPGQRPQTIPLSKIHDLPGVFNPKPPESKLGSMILSIQNSGVMEPVIVRDRGDGEYQLLSGYRRRRASELAKKTDIPAFVYEMTMQEAIAYRKAVKDNPKAPIPGKLVNAAEKDSNCICFVHRISSGYLSLNGRAQLVRFPTKFSCVPQQSHDLIAECCRL